jgi:[ribosomal protein S18]-alanine N-acetyltransferase
MTTQLVTIRNAVPEDIPDLLRIEQQSFCDAQWDEKALLTYNCRVAEIGGGVAGFLVWRRITGPSSLEFPEEREILNLAVDPAWRRRGIGRALLQEELNANAVYYLEVRESNLAAQLLYGSCGFAEVGRRPDYYHHPTEPAIVMRHE